MRRYTALALGVAALGLTGCHCSATQQPAAGDAGSSRTDFGTGPLKTYVSIGYPRPMESAVKTMPEVPLTIQHLGTDFAQAKQLLRSAFSVAPAGGGAALTGTWTFRPDEHRVDSDAYWKPTAALKSDTEYAITISQSSKLWTKTPKVSFHVGSLPRVRAITFGAKYKPTYDPTKVLKVLVAFSEGIVSSHAKKLEVRAKATNKLLASSATQPLASRTPARICTLNLASPHDAKDELTIYVDPDVGALSGKKLDGKYTGKPGSGAFSVTLRPSDYISAKQIRDWVPPITNSP